MESVIDKLNLLLDPFCWEITIKNNEDEVSEYTIIVDGQVLCSAYDVESLIYHLEDEGTLLGFV